MEFHLEDQENHEQHQDVHSQEKEVNCKTKYSTTVSLLQTNSCSQVMKQHKAVSATLPSTYMCLSWFALVCCICPIGITALCFSIAARNNFIDGNIRSAKTYRTYALVLSIFSIVGGISTCLYIFLIIYKNYKGQ